MAQEQEVDFYEPLRFEWSDAEYQAIKAVHEFSASLGNAWATATTRAVEYQRAHANDDVQEWAARLAADVAEAND